MTKSPLRWLLFILIIGAFVLSACSSAEAPESTAASSTTVAVATTPSTEAPTSTAAPTTTVLAVEPVTPASFVDELLPWMNGEGVASEEDYERIFAPSFRDTVPLVEFNALFAQITPLAPWTVTETLAEDESGGLYLLMGVAEPTLLLDFELREGQVVDANLMPWAEPAVSFDEAVAAVESLGQTSYLIAETTSGSCVSVVDGGADQIIPLGSVFKLIVLGALVDAIAEGRTTWDTEVEIRDELDSYPSGTAQDVAAGTQMTVRELAELMISISDNTATDHLIDLLGREQVEAAQSAYGVSQPELNQPFLTTRELFQLKLNPELRDRYLDADEALRREILVEVADIPLAPVDQAVVGWTGPIELETLEWFATPADVCQMLQTLNADGDAAQILQINPGVADASGRWETIGFKGGSEPGLLAVAWIVTDANGRTFTVTGAAVSDGLIEEASAINAFVGLRDQFEAP